MDDSNKIGNTADDFEVLQVLGSGAFGNVLKVKSKKAKIIKFKSHKDNFDEFYDRNTLRPRTMRLYVDENNIPIYGMIIYVIDYKKEHMSRSACGGYYPFEFDNSILLPHPYQESICW